jgi:hypothetical protein
MPSVVPGRTNAAAEEVAEAAEAVGLVLAKAPLTKWTSSEESWDWMS